MRKLEDPTMTQNNHGHFVPARHGLASGWLGLIAVATVVAALVSGCGSHIVQQYHVVSTDGLERNYYRVRIEGTARLTSSEFQAGIVDAAAIDQLLGEFTESFSNDREPPAEQTARGLPDRPFERLNALESAVRPVREHFGQPLRVVIDEMRAFEAFGDRRVQQDEILERQLVAERVQMLAK